MAVPVARVHLKVAHAALPALLPTPPNNWKMLPLLRTPTCVAATLPKALAKPGRADSDERWDAHKAKPACPASSASPSSRPRSADSVARSSAGAGHGSPPRKNATSPPMPGRADSVERWDAHKHNKAAIPASSSSSSSSGTSSLLSRWPISRARATSPERWDAHKKRCPPQPQAKPLDDGESSGTGSNDIGNTEEEEIVWKPRAMYAGQGFAVNMPESSMLPMATAFLVPVA